MPDGPLARLITYDPPVAVIAVDPFEDPLGLDGLEDWRLSRQSDTTPVLDAAPLLAGDNLPPIRLADVLGDGAAGPMSVTPLTPTLRRRRQRQFVLVVALVGVIVGVSAWALTRLSQPLGTSSIHVSGTVTLVDEGVTRFKDQPCSGTGGFADLRNGAEVLITDSTGAYLTVAYLESGHGVALSNNCVFSFSTKVPAGLGMYGVKVTHRETKPVSEEQLHSPLRFTVSR